MSECASIRYMLPVAAADAMTGLYLGTIRSRRRSRCTDFGGAAGDALGRVRRQPKPVPNLGKVKRASGPLGQLQSFGKPGDSMSRTARMHHPGEERWPL